MKKDIVLFSLCLLIAGLFSAFNGQENWWDFFNYHYYNGWAAFNGKTFDNFMLADKNTYLNPILDVFTYLLVDRFNHMPKLIFFVQGLWTGALWFLVYKFARLLMPKADVLGIGVALCFALFGHAVVRQIGTSTNEIPVSVIFLSGLYIFVKNYLLRKTNKAILPAVMAGLLMGSAVGLKLTVAVPALAFALVLTGWVFKEKSGQNVKIYVFLGLAVLAGFLVINGFWMWRVWIELGNPVSPYWNNIFGSSLLESESFRDTRFLPRDFVDMIFLPVHCVYPTTVMTDMPTSSIFLVVLLIAMWVFPCVLLLQKDKIKQRMGKDCWFLLAFWWVNYLLWLNMFAILRYAIVVEVVGGLLFVYFVQNMVKQKEIRRFVFVVLFVMSSIMGLNHTYFWRVEVKDSYLPDLQTMIFARDSIIVTNGITSFLIPFISGNFKILHIDYGFTNFLKKNPDRKIVLLSWSSANLDFYQEQGRTCKPTGFGFPKPVFMCGFIDEKTGLMEGIKASEFEEILKKRVPLK